MTTWFNLNKRIARECGIDEGELVETKAIKSCTGIEYFHETEVSFEDLVERLVLDLVVLDPQQEVVQH